MDGRRSPRRTRPRRCAMNATTQREVFVVETHTGDAITASRIESEARENGESIAQFALDEGYALHLYIERHTLH